jgi:PHD/YefM family antitoxin component YafN of YafNO toxin-antitoxin module
MGRTVKISEARRTLFELVEEVTSAEDAVVWIEHRDRAEAAALVSAEYLRGLERRLEELRRQTPFTLAGSMRLVGTATDLDADLDELRRRQGELTDAKFRDL